MGLFLTGCTVHTSSNSNEPNPVQSSIAAPEPAPVQSTSAAPDPCTLLSTVDRSTAGLTSPGKSKTIGADRACDWTEPGIFGLTVTLADSTPLPALRVPKGGAQQSTMGRHRAVKVSANAGSGTCAVLLAAGENASVQVDVTNSEFRDTTLACRRASTVAELIEPKLP